MAALFPTKEFNVHVNPAVHPPAIPLIRPPTVVQPPPVVQPPAETSKTAAPARATVISPQMAGATLKRPPPLGPRLAIPARNPAHIALSAYTPLEPDSAKNQPPDSAMDTGTDMDIDVDLGLDLDMDMDPIPEPEEKPRVSPPPSVIPGDPQTTSTRQISEVPAASAPGTAAPPNEARSSMPPSQPGAAQPPATGPSHQLPPAVQPLVERPEPAKETEIPESSQVLQDNTQGLQLMIESSSKNNIDGQTTTMEPIPSGITTNGIERNDPASKPSAEIPATIEPVSIPAAMAETSTAQVLPTKADSVVAAEPTPMVPAADDHVEIRPVPAESETRPSAEPRNGTPQQPTQIESNPLPIAAEPQQILANDAMQIDTEDTQLRPEPSQSVAMEVQQDEVPQPALPASPPPPSPPSSSALPQPSPPGEVAPALPSSSEEVAPRPPSPPRRDLPSPPQNSPPPLPESSPVRAISPPMVSHTPTSARTNSLALPAEEPANGAPFAKLDPPVPDDSLPVDPPVPEGGGRLQVEVLIDEVEFENSVDGYFRRFSAEIHPDDLHYCDLLAAYGFTKFFQQHLLNKKCAITSAIAVLELKQLVQDGGGTLVALRPDAPEPFDIIIVSNDLFLQLLQADAEGALGSSLGTREVWSFGPSDDLDPPQWRLKRHIPARSGMVSFCSQAIIKSPDLFLDCLRKMHALPNWTAFLSAATIRAIHNYLRHPSTPQTLRLKMYTTLNEAVGLFALRYPRNTHNDPDRLIRERQRQVVRSTETMNRWQDLLGEVLRNVDLLSTGDLCSNLPAEKVPANERKYWERDAEILQELQEHQEKIDQIYVVKRSIFVGFDHSTIRKGLGEDAIAELGFPGVEGYRIEEFLRDLTRDIRFAGLLLPSELGRRR